MLLRGSSWQARSKGANTHRRALNLGLDIVPGRPLETEAFAEDVESTSPSDSPPCTQRPGLEE